MLWTYWAFALGALRNAQADWRPLWLGFSVVMAITAALACFTTAKLRQRDWRPAFLIAWFIFVVAPVLPLRNHFTEYYVLVPSIGLAILAGWALASARGTAAIVAGFLAALYLTVSIADLHMTERFFYDRSRTMKYIVQGLQSFPKAGDGKALLLDGIDNGMFWGGISDDPFRLLGISRVYVTPGSEASIDPHPRWGGLFAKFVISLDDAAALLRQHDVLVVHLEGRRLRDITASYLPRFSAKYVALHPDFVDVADPLYQSSVGPTWYPPENDYRWMPKTATVKIAAPQRAGQMLLVTGFCPAVVVTGGPLTVSFRADGTLLGKATLKEPDHPIELSFQAPAKPTGTSMMEIEIEVNRTSRIPGDERDLGLVFGTFTMK
jgi:hypothetical protein